MAPKKSIILIEDVDAIFTERKNADKLNALTFSGFLNAIDGVRSQEGRILIMTTNFK
jgi:chaperone BCS1